MAKLSVRQFIQDQRRKAPPLIRADLTGQTVVVVGASAGLGLWAAKHYATMNPARLILACRNRSKGEAVVDEIKREIGYANAEVKLVDLADFASVSAFADEFEKEDARVDVLLANAGMGKEYYTQTKDGWETVLQVNHLATSMLCLLLLPRMIKTAQRYLTNPRLTIVASESHYFTKVKDELFAQPSILQRLSEKEYCTTLAMYDRYGLTKLFNVLFTRALANALPPASPVVVNCVTPGFCYSSLRDSLSLFTWLFSVILEVFLARSTADGASVLVWASLAGTAGETSPELRDNLRGAYVNAWRIEEPSDFVVSEKGKESESRIWRETVDLLAQKDSRIRNIVDEHLRPS